MRFDVGKVDETNQEFVRGEAAAEAPLDERWACVGDWRYGNFTSAYRSPG
jgi:hypothetical protein